MKHIIKNSRAKYLQQYSITIEQFNFIEFSDCEAEIFVEGSTTVIGAVNSLLERNCWGTGGSSISDGSYGGGF
ncbi:hypothetical protein NIES2107_31880 [Nostoc carneum NIES-2107]|nr:hypothetical protein NIES2107_31880 [Nostoc carneum NIES-2107]